VQNFRLQHDRHLDLLRSHASAYDDGREHFAYEMATKIRVFVHDTFDRRGRPSSVSLLTHLGIKDRLGYVDWGPPEGSPGAITVGFGLCTLRMKTDADGGSVSYVPASDGDIDPLRQHPLTSFAEWWRLELMDAPLSFTRADFVLSVANQEGAHVDAVLDARYAALSRENALGITTDDGGPPSKDVALASVRHIAAELIERLEQGLEWDADRAVVTRPLCPLPLVSHEGQSATRNDPCPCGGGRKAKHCFGQRRPRNVMTTPGQSRLWVPLRRPLEPIDVDLDEASTIAGGTSSFSFRVPLC